MFAKISAGSSKICEHPQPQATDKSFFSKVESRIVTLYTSPAFAPLALLLLHFVFLVVVVVVVVYCSRVLYESQIQMASSGTTLCCVCHVTLAICDIVANIKLGNVHAEFEDLAPRII